MSISNPLERELNIAERQLLANLNSPDKIQLFLDELTYSTEPIYRCPLRVLRDRTAHCFDGGMFAAAALSRLGFPPLVVDLIPSNRDDDHLLAVYKVDGYWGAVAKSNFVGLRFREPIFRSLRELVMSYFEQYYNINHEKTLRGYTMPLNLKKFDRYEWTIKDEPLDLIAHHLDEIRKFNILTPTMIDRLAAVDERSYQAGLSGSNPAGLYQPPPHEKSVEKSK
jgi:hypothetical protein